MTPTPPTHYSRTGLLIILAAIICTLAAVAAVTYKLTTDHGPRTYATAHDMQAALRAGGFDCVNWADEPDSLGPESAGTCWYDGNQVTISLYDNADDRENAEKAGVQLATDLGVSSSDGTYVAGGPWMVNTPSQSAARQVQAILGGKIR